MFSILTGFFAFELPFYHGESQQQGSCQKLMKNQIEKLSKYVRGTELFLQFNLHCIITR